MLWRKRRRGHTRHRHYWSVRRSALSMGLLAVSGAVVLAAGTKQPETDTSARSSIAFRSDRAPITLPAPVIAPDGPPVSHQLRRPVRVTDNGGTQHNLTFLVTQAFDELSLSANPPDILFEFLLQALAEGRTDDEIDTLLNDAFAKGHFQVPPLLITSNGDFDTRKVLDAVLTQVAG